MRLFASAREAAGRSTDELDAPNLGEALATMRSRYGPTFAEVLGTARVWINGDEPDDGDATTLSEGDELAVLPPVSGGAGEPPG